MKYNKCSNNFMLRNQVKAGIEAYPHKKPQEREEHR